MTGQLPRLGEPFLSPLQENKSIAPPPAAFRPAPAAVDGTWRGRGRTGRACRSGEEQQ